MRIPLWTAATALLFTVAPAAAQDLPTNQLEQQAQVLTDSAILRHNLDYARRHNGSRRRPVNAYTRSRSTASPATVARARALCANRAQFRYRADYGRLVRLCTMAGYR